MEKATKIDSANKVIDFVEKELNSLSLTERRTVLSVAYNMLQKTIKSKVEVGEKTATPKKAKVKKK